MSLRDGAKKMSKSDPSDLSRINLSDDAETIARKIRKAKTDTDGLPSEAAGLKGRPEADNLTGIYAALAGTTQEDTLRQFGGGQFSVFKKALAEIAVAQLAPITSEMTRLCDDPAEIDRLLADGAQTRQSHCGADHGRGKGHRRLHPILDDCSPLYCFNIMFLSILQCNPAPVVTAQAAWQNETW